MEYYFFTPASGQQAEREESGTGTYTRNNEEVIININNPISYSIRLLNSTDLHLNLYEEEIAEGFETTLDMTQKFTKM